MNNKTKKLNKNLYLWKARLIVEEYRLNNRVNQATLGLSKYQLNKLSGIIANWGEKAEKELKPFFWSCAVLVYLKTI